MEVVVAGADRLAELEPLWLALHDHHAHTGAEDVAPVRDAVSSWERRRAQYERWMAGGDAALVVAEDGGDVLGYLVLSVGDGGMATWDVGEAVAEVETLSVAPAFRGRGVGRALLSAARDLARSRGAGSLLVGVLHTNEAAIRFYQSEGFGTFYVEMLQRLA